MAILQVSNVTKKFGSFTALDGINLEVNQGEVYGFIGPNGAGKTTTIRILLGILKATSGSAQIFGRDALERCGGNPPKDRLCSGRCEPVAESYRR